MPEFLGGLATTGFAWLLDRYLGVWERVKQWYQDQQSPPDEYKGYEVADHKFDVDTRYDAYEAKGPVKRVHHRLLHSHWPYMSRLARFWAQMRDDLLHRAVEQYRKACQRNAIDQGLDLELGRKPSDPEQKIGSKDVLLRVLRSAEFVIEGWAEDEEICGLSERTCVIVGKSGAGKTSLLLEYISLIFEHNSKRQHGWVPVYIDLELESDPVAFLTAVCPEKRAMLVVMLDGLHMAADRKPLARLKEWFNSVFICTTTLAQYQRDPFIFGADGSKPRWLYYVQELSDEAINSYMEKARKQWRFALVDELADEDEAFTFRNAAPELVRLPANLVALRNTDFRPRGLLSRVNASVICDEIARFRLKGKAEQLANEHIGSREWIGLLRRYMVWAAKKLWDNPICPLPLDEQSFSTLTRGMLIHEETKGKIVAMAYNGWLGTMMCCDEGMYQFEHDIWLQYFLSIGMWQEVLEDGWSSLLTQRRVFEHRPLVDFLTYFLATQPQGKLVRQRLVDAIRSPEKPQNLDGVRLAMNATQLLGRLWVMCVGNTSPGSFCRKAELNGIDAAYVRGEVDLNLYEGELPAPQEYAGGTMASVQFESGWELYTVASLKPEPTDKLLWFNSRETKGFEAIYTGLRLIIDDLDPDRFDEKLEEYQVRDFWFLSRRDQLTASRSSNRDYRSDEYDWGLTSSDDLENPDAGVVVLNAASAGSISV